MTGDPKATSASFRHSIEMIPEFSGRRPQSFPSILGGESSDDGVVAPRPVGVGEGSCAPPTGEGGRLCVLFLRDAGAGCVWPQGCTPVLPTRQHDPAADDALELRLMQPDYIFPKSLSGMPDVAFHLSSC